MSKYKVDVNRGLADTAPIRAGNEARPTQDFVTTAATIGVITAGAALFEVALIPGIVIGGAAVLAPKLAPRRLRKLGRRLQPLFNSTVRRRIMSTVPLPGQPDVKAPLAARPRFAIKQALAKTITFRIIVTTLDFTWNYVVIGDLTTAAGLSAFGLALGPLFYFVHETAWNYFGPSVKRKVGLSGTVVELPVLLSLRPDVKAPLAGRGRITINRALAKTITFRTIATMTNFTTKLRGGRRSRHGGYAVGLRLRGRPFYLSRPRDGLGLLWLAQRGRPRSADANKALAVASLTRGSASPQ